MSELTQEQQDQLDYQKAYDAEMERLNAADAAKTATTTAPGTAVVETPKETEPPKEGEVVEPTKEEESVEQLRERLAKAEKAIKDTQAWGTKNAQELAQLRREREQQQRLASRPQILDQAPELEQAIRHVVGDTAPQNQANDQRAAWAAQVEKVHPGIFSLPDDDPLVTNLSKKMQEMGDACNDPLEVIRVVTEEKLALKERQVGQRFAQAAAQQAKKSAMAVPGASSSGTTQRAPEDDVKKEVDRMWNMSDAEFAKMAQKVKGF
jgi:hypothetical protein